MLREASRNPNHAAGQHRQLHRSGCLAGSFASSQMAHGGVRFGHEAARRRAKEKTRHLRRGLRPTEQVPLYFRASFGSNRSKLVLSFHPLHLRSRRSTPSGLARRMPWRASVRGRSSMRRQCPLKQQSSRRWSLLFLLYRGEGSRTRPALPADAQSSSPAPLDTPSSSTG
jgi:hypothetical protein